MIALTLRMRAATARSEPRPWASGSAIVVAVELAAALALWSLASTSVLPTPREVLNALVAMWGSQSLGAELVTSCLANLEALAISTAISLAFAWASVLPMLRPMSGAATKARFLGLAGLTLPFTLWLGGGWPLRIALLCVGTTAFLSTGLIAEVAAIPLERFEHARSLRLSEGRVFIEVVVLGTLDRAFELVRQNAAIGWTMLTMVEGFTRASGGVGTLLVDQGKHFHLAEVFAIQVVIVLAGIGQDVALSFARRVACPWAESGGAS